MPGIYKVTTNGEWDPETGAFIPKEGENSNF
mgnify:FL=1